MHSERDAHCVDVALHIKELAPKALAVLEDVLDNEDASLGLRSKVAQDLLDRAGHGALNKFQTQVSHIHMTRDDIEQIKQTAIAEVRQKMSARVVDTPIEQQAQVGAL